MHPTSFCSPSAHTASHIGRHRLQLTAYPPRPAASIGCTHRTTLRMRGPAAFAHRCRPSNNVPHASRLFSIRTLASLHRPTTTVARTVCYPCLAKLRLLSSRKTNVVASYNAAASFHASAAACGGGTRTERKSASHFRRAVESHQGLREMVQKPSRMILSDTDRVARGCARERSKGDSWEVLGVETGGGMNRREFKPRSDDKRQYSRETLRRQQELRESTSRPSPSRFSQRPVTDLQAERRAAAARLEEQAAAAAAQDRDFSNRNRRDRDRGDRDRGDRDRGDREWPQRSDRQAQLRIPSLRDNGPIDPVRAERRRLAEELDAAGTGRLERYPSHVRERLDKDTDLHRREKTIRQTRERLDGPGTSVSVSERRAIARMERKNDGDRREHRGSKYDSDARSSEGLRRYRDQNLDPIRAERRALAEKLDSEASERSSFTRPPVRRFAQMKQIATLDHVSSRTREITHAAEQRFSSFESFDLLPQTVEALYKDGLKGLDDIEPTPVQSLVIPQLLERNPNPRSRPVSQPTSRDKRKNAASAPATSLDTDDDTPFSDTFQTYLVAAETGSGKTLAYVLPLMDTLKRRELARVEEEEAEKFNARNRSPNDLNLSNRYMYDIDSPPVNHGPTISQPYAVILVPTSELVLQVGNLIKKLSYCIKLRSEMISRDFTGAVIRNRLFGRTSPLDIVVGTPFMIDRITEANPEMLHRTSHIIIDEADSLFDRSFSPLTSAIIPRAVNLEKLVLCSATIPKSLDAYVSRKFPNARRLVTANLHAIPRRVQMQVVNVEGDPYRGNKMLACAALLDDIAKDATEPGFRKRVVVFVNERDTTAPLTTFLADKGFDAVEINRDSDSRRVLESFTGDKEATDDDASASAAVRRGSVQVLVTTDLASRGVDTKNVRNVVLYDVPYTSIDFIHRLGRTGRMGRRGRAWVLVDKGSNEAYVKEVKKTMHLGQALI
ncbi:RNA helicase [Orbilia brochopaga]|uniref:ATP-dependent RNA helicase n=1 Tax=Orbilia brochopaga TaxID=3140254 RepID=A0AAV9UK66_9PEZI